MIEFAILAPIFEQNEVADKIKIIFAGNFAPCVASVKASKSTALFALPADVNQNANRRHCDYKRGAAVADKRQRDADNGR